MTLHQEIEDLTLELVKIPSMNNTVGERLLAEKIAQYLREFDYFKKHPEYVWEVPLKDDRYGRKNVFALLKGEKEASPTTIILHGHMDTVGIEDYGTLMPYAFDCLELGKKLQEVDLPPEVKEDLDSGDFLFGRGANDMKSGLASHLVVFKEMTQRVQKIKGNIIFMANPVEENQHTGVMESLPFLKELKEKEKLEYLVAINNDYIAPLYKGDTKKYIYLGAVGKLLPCFYIVGKETHVGQCFEGLDPNLIAAELLKLINMNVDLCDEYEGEYSLPPAALKCTDLKPSYNVQTPLASFLYFNYFTHDLPVDKILELLREKADLACANVLTYLDAQFRNYCIKTGLDFSPIPWRPVIVSYEELYAQVKKELGAELDKKIEALAKDLFTQGTDTRIICLKVVEEVKRLSKDPKPMVVIYFSPPYCPHNTVKGKNAAEKSLVETLNETIAEISSTTGEIFEVRKFFPCLSDSSYLTMDDDDNSVAALINNFPEWDVVYPVPIKMIREANIPAINFGTYGKDAHRWTERVHKPYTFSVLPKMTILAIEKLLGGVSK